MNIIIFVSLLTILGQNSFAQDIKAINLVERQKTTFKTQDWPDFFANALYLRAWLFNDDLRWTTPGLDQALSLEILALTQHCQFELANTIAQEVLSHPQSAAISKKFLVEAQEQIKLQKAFNHLAVQEKTFNKDPKSIHWPISYSTILKVSSIEQLKVHLDNLCQDGKS